VEALVASVCVQYPSIYPVVRELFRVPELLSAPETTVVAGEALKAAYAAGFVGKDDAGKIEEAILKIPDAVAILRYEKPESIRNRLLMCIPGDQLQSETLKKLFAELSESKQVRANEPYHRMTFEQRAFGTEDFLREQGVDPSSRGNAELLKALKPLQSFEHKYMNQVANTNECERIESQIVTLREMLVRGDADEKVRDGANGTLCAVAETILKNDQLKSEQSVVKASREIVLSGAKSSDPKFDPKYHLPFE
jgi:hypothetical protein